MEETTEVGEFKTLEEVAASMSGHIGTEGYYAVDKSDYVIMTSGVLDFVQKTNSKWLIDLFNSDSLKETFEKQMLVTRMVVVKIRSDKSGVNISFEDGNYNVITEKNSEEDMLLGEFDIWLEPMRENLVALLPSEH
tara:strand:+ start:15401 stop:15808 length:408 start_codon:yes stop_codon:yes gene_type:complete